MSEHLPTPPTDLVDLETAKRRLVGAIIEEMNAMIANERTVKLNPGPYVYVSSGHQEKAVEEAAMAFLSTGYKVTFEAKNHKDGYFHPTRVTISVSNEVNHGL